ncbi:MAG TPA: DUF3109 family protein [Bacteroidota bacterium]|nr:DUF3109 family protein [Bacteroidota bacterium]
MKNVGNIMIDEELFSVRFACDLGKCRGACCTLEGGRGAPLTDAEAENVRRHYPAIKKYLPAEHLETIRTDGLVEGIPGSYATICHHRRACVFVYYDGVIAKCAFERAYLDGEIPWRKPASCHLFPLRFRDGALPVLKYEPIRECLPALEHGARNDIRLTDFLQASLSSVFGTAWYARVQALAASGPAPAETSPSL